MFPRKIGKLFKTHKILNLYWKMRLWNVVGIKKLEYQDVGDL